MEKERIRGKGYGYRDGQQGERGDAKRIVGLGCV